MRDYQAEIDASRGAARREREMVRIREKEMISRQGRAIREWNAKSAPDGFMAMKLEEWRIRAKELERMIESALFREFEGASASIDWEEGDHPLLGGGDAARGMIEVGFGKVEGAGVSLAEDNAIRLLVAKRTGLITKQDIGPILRWDFEYGIRTLALGPYADDATVVLVHSEWGSWDLHEEFSHGRS